jgi:mannose-6-phosphate isomerase-like protein (cupin superfamily)/uncharacterized protein YndB with AHSA1/START domain
MLQATKAHMLLRASAAELLRRLPGPPSRKWPDGERFTKAFAHGSLTVELYAPVGHDRQTPHDRDEVYFVVSGSGEFVVTGERVPFSAGDTLFVAAGSEHRFENFTSDLATWVVFYGPKGGEKWGAMTTITTEAVIAKSPAAVFDYVTTPAHWPVWHPSSLGLHGATDHSLQIGEEVTEDFRVAGRKGSVTWKVVAREAPTRWAIAGKVAGGGNGTITYTLSQIPEGTAFSREFVYAMPNWFAALLDRMYIRRRIEAESTEALVRLKRALEEVV